MAPKKGSTKKDASQDNSTEGEYNKDKNIASLEQQINTMEELINHMDAKIDQLLAKNNKGNDMDVKPPSSSTETSSVIPKATNINTERKSNNLAQIQMHKNRRI